MFDEREGERRGLSLALLGSKCGVFCYRLMGSGSINPGPGQSDPWSILSRGRMICADPGLEMQSWDKG